MLLSGVLAGAALSFQWPTDTLAESKESRQRVLHQWGGLLMLYLSSCAARSSTERCASPSDSSPISASRKCPITCAAVWSLYTSKSRQAGEDAHTSKGISTRAAPGRTGCHHVQKALCPLRSGHQICTTRGSERIFGATVTELSSVRNAQRVKRCPGRNLSIAALLHGYLVKYCLTRMSKGRVGSLVPCPCNTGGHMVRECATLRQRMHERRV